MKKTRLLTTILAVAIMVVCMCGMVFGYAYNATCLAGKSIGLTEVFSNISFYQSQTKRCLLQPYYKSISSDGKYIITLYKKQNETRELYDSVDKTVNLKTTSGFYTSKMMLDKGYNYEPSLRCTGGATMNLKYLEIHFD